MQHLPRQQRKTIIYCCILVCISIAIRIFAINKQNVETVYSTGIYPTIAKILRILTGWLPVSIGDVLYAVVIVWLLYKMIRYRKHLVAYNQYLPGVKKNALRWVNKLLLVYIVFNLFWGLNYNRLGIHHQLGFTREKYSKEDLVLMNELLLQKVNGSRLAVKDADFNYSSRSILFGKAADAYKRAATQYPFLGYRAVALKKSYYSWVGNYLGFSGYYNPFTGEAQVNTSIPQFLQPFVSCHEVAHQLGYAKENEANFVGYLVATGSEDAAFRYSAYLDIFLYANRNLYAADSLQAMLIRSNLDPLVKADVETMRNFYRKFQNPVEPYVRWAYGKYLQANDQPSGMLSYNEVIADLIGYYKRYGRIADL